MRIARVVLFFPSLRTMRARSLSIFPRIAWCAPRDLLFAVRARARAARNNNWYESRENGNLRACARATYFRVREMPVCSVCMEIATLISPVRAGMRGAKAAIIVLLEWSNKSQLARRIFHIARSCIKLIARQEKTITLRGGWKKKNSNVYLTVGV